MAFLVYDARKDEFNVFADNGEWYAQGSFEDMQVVMFNLSLAEAREEEEANYD